MHVNIGHLGHLLLILHDHCRTLCPTFWSKTSDIGVKTSDMSGCPTVFQIHCNVIGQRHEFDLKPRMDLLTEIVQ